MNEKQQVQVGLHREKYDRLEQLKQCVEAELGRRLIWGDFLLILAGLSAETGEEQVAHLEQEEPLDEEIATCLREQLGSPEVATTEAVEEIVGRHTDKVIEELKKLR